MISLSNKRTTWRILGMTISVYSHTSWAKDTILPPLRSIHSGYSAPRYGVQAVCYTWQLPWPQAYKCGITNTHPWTHAHTHTFTHMHALRVSVRSDEHSSIDVSWQWHFPQATVALETDITSRLLSFMESFKE